MTKEELIETGFINYGYISPELSTSDTYPDYIKENVLEAVKKIQSHQTRNSLTFAFMTDLHYSTNENHDIRTKRLMNAYSELKRKVHIDKLILGGDFCNDGCKPYKVRNYTELRNFVGDEKYFPVNGNHDDNSIWDALIENDTSVNHMTQEELYTVFYNHLPSLGARFNNKSPGLYYYYNDDVQKVRYIFLDTQDIPYLVDENGKLIYTKQHTFAISQAQADWLVNEALCVDENWEIIVVAHNFPTENDKHPADGNDLVNLDIITEVLNAYQNGQDIEKSFYEDEFLINVKADFSGRKRANIIACFSGHYHDDFEVVTKSGIPVIYTGNVIMYKYRIPRIDGEKSELLFDVVTIDRDSKTIYTTRIGQGEDRVIKY